MDEKDDGYRWIDPKTINIIYNPRTLNNPGFAPEKMDELYRDIQKVGLNHPLAVWLKPETSIYQLIGGERRLRTILRLRDSDDECRCPRGTGQLLPASKAYDLVKCRIVYAESERDAKRIARKDNMLHEALTDYEVLKQVAEMDKDGFTRTEQAEDFDKSEAWISQSHSLLALCDEFPEIQQAMHCGHLGRTQALTFLPIWEKTPDKVADVFRTAYENRFLACSLKEEQARKQEEEIVSELDISESELKLAEMEGDQSGIKSIHRRVKQVAQKHKVAQRRVEAARAARESLRMSVEDITSATGKVAGAEDVLSKPITVKNVRIFRDELTQKLDGEGDSIDFNGVALPKGQVALIRDVMDWYVGAKRLKHPLDLLAS